MAVRPSIRQVKAARALLEWSQRDLAEHSGVSLPTIQRIEASGAPGSAQTMDKLKDALEAAGIDFIPENGGGAGVRLREPRNPVTE